MWTQPAPKGHFSLRSGLTIFPVQQEAIEQQLSSLAQKLPARFLLLADVTGMVVSAKGEQQQIDLVGLGSLVACELAANQEIARLTRQQEEYQLNLHEGQQINTFVVEAGNHLALLVQTAHEVPLGWARMLIWKTARQLADIVATAPETTEKTELQLSQADILPDLFSDALDELWKE